MTDSKEALTAYEVQVLIGTSISGCNMPPDRVFDLPAAWKRLNALGMIDRTDGLAIVTPAGEARIAAALSASSPPVGGSGEVVVKPLEWKDRADHDEDGGYDVVGSIAETAFQHQYWTSENHDEEGRWRLYFGLKILGRFDTEAAAKAAAQADYETRIRSALAAPVDPAAMIQFKLRNGSLCTSAVAGEAFWTHDPDLEGEDIIAYRLANPV